MGRLKVPGFAGGWATLLPSQAGATYTGLYSSGVTLATSGGAATYTLANDGVADSAEEFKSYFFDTGRTLDNLIDGLQFHVDQIAHVTGTPELYLGWSNGTNPSAAAYVSQMIGVRTNVGGVATTWSQLGCLSDGGPGSRTSSASRTNCDTLSHLDARVLWASSLFGARDLRAGMVYSTGALYSILNDANLRDGLTGQPLYFVIAVGNAAASISGITARCRAIVLPTP